MHLSFLCYVYESQWCNIKTQGEVRKRELQSTICVAYHRIGMLFLTCRSGKCKHKVIINLKKLPVKPPPRLLLRSCFPSSLRCRLNLRAGLIPWVSSGILDFLRSEGGGQRKLFNCRKSEIKKNGETEIKMKQSQNQDTLIEGMLGLLKNNHDSRHSVCKDALKKKQRYSWNNYRCTEKSVPRRNW